MSINTLLKAFDIVLKSAKSVTSGICEITAQGITNDTCYISCTPPIFPAQWYGREDLPLKIQKLINRIDHPESKRIQAKFLAFKKNGKITFLKPR